MSMEDLQKQLQQDGQQKLSLVEHAASTLQAGVQKAYDGFQKSAEGLSSNLQKISEQSREDYRATLASERKIQEDRIAAILKSADEKVREHQLAAAKQIEQAHAERKRLMRLWLPVSAGIFLLGIGLAWASQYWVADKGLAMTLNSMQQQTAKDLALAKTELEKAKMDLAQVTQDLQASRARVQQWRILERVDLKVDSQGAVWAVPKDSQVTQYTWGTEKTPVVELLVQPK